MIEIRIKDACQRKDVTQQELADHLKVSRQTVYRYWRNNRIRVVNLDVLEQIANYLGVPAKDLIVETQEPT